MNKIKEFIKTYWMILVSTAIILCIFKTIFIVAFVPTGSMENTINVGDVTIGYRLQKQYNRGDVIAFKDPNNGYRTLCKRIIGVEGDHIKVTENGVYLNGELLNEPYTKEDYIELGINDYYVPDGCVFLMGDNRNNSNDSRFWYEPYVKTENIKAKILYCIAPIKKIY